MNCIFLSKLTLLVAFAMVIIGFFINSALLFLGGYLLVLPVGLLVLHMAEFHNWGKVKK